MWSTIKFFLYRMIYGTYYRYIIYVRTRKIRKELCILDSISTIRYILEKKCSICRFGDGELRMIAYYLKNRDNITNYNIDSFQQYDVRLARKLLQVLLSDFSNCLVCIPYVFKKFSVYRKYEKFHFEREYCYYHKLMDKVYRERNNLNFGDSCFTRFYFHRTDIKDYVSYIQSLKQIWKNQDIVFLEGEKSRLGVGNDLFNNANSIQRFLLPTTNAFSKYDEILDAVKKMPKDKLYLIALGHTATVLAYDMAQLGYWAIDIGHVDIEYEWMRMNVDSKVAIPNKYVNEVPEGRISTELDDPEYLSQIIGRIE